MSKPNPILIRLIGILDKLVSIFVFLVAVLLVLFMVIRIVQASYLFIEWLIVHPISLETGHDDQVPAYFMLHGIALAVVFVKAYRLLIAYATHHHVSIKYVIEISIIAPAVEIVFNNNAYEPLMLVLLGVFGLANLVLYLVYYQRLTGMEPSDE